ncbi:hypothetical protein FF011L_08990 [Roseimaritima multifibrata]|uniref:Uncharacterized protein n=1 Tax=Roseimaritima multifibrata TaxID=1930274 RepID=A0A517MBB0_9BACT|nr:hypothetical protein FF011L_08990 [Roseimaritima multifibrata]
MSFCSKCPREASSFRISSDSRLQDSSLPLSEVIDQSIFDEAFERFDVDFSCDDDAVYTPALVLWALRSQALFKDGPFSPCTSIIPQELVVDRHAKFLASWWPPKPVPPHKAVAVLLSCDAEVRACCKWSRRRPCDVPELSERMDG